MVQRIILQQILKLKFKTNRKKINFYKLKK
jgi:hypothetical protein